MLGHITPDNKQLEVLALPPAGHTVVLGTAGSGKTTMALLRAIGLSQRPEHPKVLVVTFNVALVQYMSELNDARINNLTIESFHKFARGYLNSLGKMPRVNGILDSTDKEEYIGTALEAIRSRYPSESTLKRPLSVFVDEITFIQRFGFNNLNDYASAERIGRSSVNIKRENRKWFYMVYTEYLRIREANGYLYDWDDIAYFVYKELLNDTRPRMYNHIIVDEGQDFSPVMLRALTAAVPQNGSFTFFGDVAQQIYGNRLSWRDSGIQLRDKRIWKFDRNYRNPTTVATFANNLMMSPYWLKSEDIIPPARYIAEGPKPILIHFQSKSEEKKWLISQIRSTMSTSSNLIVCRDRATVKLLCSSLKINNIPSTIITRDRADLSSKTGVYLSTFHSAKGLEFDNVYIPYLTDGVFPDPNTVANAPDEKSALANELKLLYVAVTRSKFGLFMSYHGKLSSLFPAPSTTYDQFEGDNL